MEQAPNIMKSQKSADDEWLSLHEAAGLLGVHPGTVRIWSDKGRLPVYRTEGGHRRYKRSEVLLWANTARAERVVDPVSVVQAAVHNIRVHITEGHLESESWYQKLDEGARTQYRQSAQSLVQGLISYVSSGGEEGASEARSIGYEYASRAHRFGLSNVDAARAFLFFRNALLQSVIQVYQEANVPSGNAWGEILYKVNTYTDVILMHLLETYHAMESANS